MLISKIKSITNGRVITKDSKTRDDEEYTVYITNKKGEDVSNKNFATIQEAREYQRKMIMEGYHAEMYPYKDSKVKDADDPHDKPMGLSCKECGKELTWNEYESGKCSECKKPITDCNAKDGGPGSGRKPEGGSAEPGGKNKFYKGRGNTVHKGHTIYETRKNTDYPPHYVVKNKKFKTHAEAVAYINSLSSKKG